MAIARGIVNQPAILLADEPTGNLDSQNSAAVLRVMKDLNERTGQTILMITHDAEAAALRQPLGAYPRRPDCVGAKRASD